MNVFRCDEGENVTALVTKCCVGKTSCNVECDQSSCVCKGGPSVSVGDPCYDTKKELAIAVTCAGTNLFTMLSTLDIKKKKK